ncbi:hypothetical protein Tco_0451959 [Tanacetum coccineum]
MMPATTVRRIESEVKQGALYLLRWAMGVRAQVVAIGFSKNGVLYFNAVPRNGIYEIDMHDLVPNVNSIYNKSATRILNMASNKKVTKHHMNRWYGKVPNLSLLKETQRRKRWVPISTSHLGKQNCWLQEYAELFENRLHNVNEISGDVEGGRSWRKFKKDSPVCGEPHWTAVKNILKYLRNTKDMFLVYGGNPSIELRVECYCDAGFETDRDDTKSQTGYVFILNGGAVDWKSSKQSTTAMSATESEYIAASEAAMEAVWIRKFISGLGIVPMIMNL